MSIGYIIRDWEQGSYMTFEHSNLDKKRFSCMIHISLLLNETKKNTSYFSGYSLF